MTSTVFFHSVGTFFAFASLLLGKAILEEGNWDEDAKLVRKVKEGDRDAYELLFNKYCNRIYAYCFWLLSRRRGGAEEAKDATQEAFTRCLEKILSLRRDDSFYYFLRMTARNICLDIGKSNPALTPVDDEKPKEVVDEERNRQPETATMTSQNRELIMEALNALDEKYRLAVIHVHYEGCSYREAAGMIGCRESDIKKWVHRGIRKMADKLRDKRELW